MELFKPEKNIDDRAYFLWNYTEALCPECAATAEEVCITSKEVATEADAVTCILCGKEI